MAVVKKSGGRWPTSTITYSVAGTKDEGWLEEGIGQFHAAIEREVFVRASDAATPHVRFVLSSQGESRIGFGGSGTQDINYHRSEGADLAQFKTLHHEIGHCLGLGHEQFHSQYEYKDPIETMLRSTDNFREVVTLRGLQGDDYADFGPCDSKSIMMYQLTSMLAPGRIEENVRNLSRVTLYIQPMDSAAPTSRPRTSSLPKASVAAASAPASLLSPRLQFPGSAPAGGDRLTEQDIAAIRQLLPST